MIVDEANPTNGMTLNRHIRTEQKQHMQARGDLTTILSSIGLAAKIVSSEVRRAGLANVLGLTGDKNVQGEEVKKLDVLANDTFIEVLNYCEQICVMGSEENEDLIKITHKPGKYTVVFDPLDGSSNIDCNSSIGSIFSIQKRLSAGEEGVMEDLLQAGKTQVAAGYIMYGSSTIFVYTTGDDVNGFTLDPLVGEFFLSHPEIKIPDKGKIYSINEGNRPYWSKNVKDYVDYVTKLDPETKRPYSSRYIGSMVADIHRTLIYGGIFMYPDDSKSPKGKLRLLYEVSPMAMIVEKAGGMAVDGENNILDIIPESLHQRTPAFLGSKENIKEFLSFT